MYRKKEEDWKAQIVAAVKADFGARQAARREFESRWQLNASFLAGNQYCAITGSGEVASTYRDYYWQSREVFNHIAPIVEARLAKLNNVRPKMSVRPSSSDDNDIKTALTASKILNSAYHKLDIDSVLFKGTQWSEVLGSVFYKLSWDSGAGRLVGVKDGQRVHEGDVRIDVCSPYEIYPDSIAAADIADCASIIHARAMPIEEIEQIYGKLVQPQDVLTLNESGSGLLEPKAAVR